MLRGNLHGQTNVDEEVGGATGLEDDRERRDEDCEEVEADIAVGGRHFGRVGGEVGFGLG